jgi:hypothetical protein
MPEGFWYGKYRSSAFLRNQPFWLDYPGIYFLKLKIKQLEYLNKTDDHHGGFSLFSLTGWALPVEQKRFGGQFLQPLSK